MTRTSSNTQHDTGLIATLQTMAAAGFAAIVLTAAAADPALAAGTLRIGMTASDIPLTTGQTDQGGEGQRFMGYTVYNSLIEWDLSSADKPSALIPSLATSWQVDATDKTKWTFKLRDGVKFHDGSVFNADAVVWNLDKLLKPDAPQFDKRQSAQGKSRIPGVASYKAIDPLTVEITTNGPDATLPYQAIRSLILPAGLKYSTLARIRASRRRFLR